MGSFFINRDQRERILRETVATFLQNGCIIAAFTLLWVWMEAFMGDATGLFGDLRIQGDEPWTGEGRLFQEALSLGILCCFLLVALWHITTKGELCRSECLWIALACMVVGVAVAFAWVETSGESILLCLLAAAALTAGTTLIVIQYMGVAGALGTHRTLVVCALSLLLSVVVRGLLELLPFASGAVVIVAPIAMVGLLKRGITLLVPAGLPVKKREDVLKVPRKFCLTCFCQGVGAGVPVAALTVDGTDISLLGAAVAVVLVGLSFFLVRLDFNLLIYQIGFALMGAGFVLLSWPEVPALLGSMCKNAGYSVVDIAFWTLSAYLIKNAGLSTTWIAVGPSSALMLGNLVAPMAASQAAVSIPFERQLVLCATLWCFFFVCALFLSSRSNVRTGWGTIDPMSSEEGTVLNAACAYLSNEYDLTSREGEVLGQLAQGGSRKEVAEALFLSEDTIKTHMRGIYRKLDVHSRAELDQRIALAAETLDAEGRAD